MSDTSDRTQLIESLRSYIAERLHIPPEDRDLIDFILAVYISNLLPGDPLWGMVVDASGGGKTELLRPLKKRPDVVFVSSLSEKSLISGYRDPRNPDKDPSLLRELNGKVLVIKDLSPLLSMRYDSRNKILADLRDAYDGFTDPVRGNTGRVSYQAKFTVLAATTLAVERYDTVEQELGERFLKFRLRSTETRAKVRRAILNLCRDDSVRLEIEAAVEEYLKLLFPTKIKPEVPEELVEALTLISDFTAIARSNVPRDRQHDLRYQPRPEVGTRLAKELGKLLLALAIVRGKREPDAEDLRTVARAAEDSMPPNRLAVVCCLLANAEPLTVQQLAEVANLPRSTVGHTLADLQVLGIAALEDGAWRIAPEWLNPQDDKDLRRPAVYMGSRFLYREQATARRVPRETAGQHEDVLVPVNQPPRERTDTPSDVASEPSTRPAARADGFDNFPTVNADDYPTLLGSEEQP